MYAPSMIVAWCISILSDYLLAFISINLCRQHSFKGTTALQALVNLKSSSLRLSPLSIESQDENEVPSVYDAPHGLEFHYDCDAPKCKIIVNAVPCKSVESVLLPA